MVPSMTQPPYQAPGVPHEQHPVSPGPHPPQQYAPPASPQPYPLMPPPKKSFWSSTGGVLTIIGIVIGAVILLCGGLAAVGLVGGQAAASKMHVELTSCEFTASDVLPSVDVGYTVTNNGDSTRSARIEIEYRDSSGARIDTDTAYVRDIAPGDTVRGEETTILDAAPSGSGRCVVVGVS